MASKHMGVNGWDAPRRRISPVGPNSMADFRVAFPDGSINPGIWMSKLKEMS